MICPRFITVSASVFLSLSISFEKPQLVIADGPLTTVVNASLANPEGAPSAGSLERAAKYSMSHNGQTFIAMFDGKIIAEEYGPGGSPDRVQMLASGSKSFVGVVAAAAVEDGIIKLDDPVSKSLIEWRDHPQKSRITYRQLLSLTSGLKASDRSFVRNQPAWKETAAGPMTGKPGEQFQYGANQLNVFAFALQQNLNSETFEAYLKRRILDPLGIKVEWRGRCADGHPQLGGGGFITSRDWVTFGEFVRLRGSWKGKQIVASEQLSECFEGSEANPAYGLTWWLKNKVSPELVRENPVMRSDWADVANSSELPNDLVAACGAGKQRLYIIPSRKLVVVRQGGFAARGFSDTLFLERLLNTLSTTSTD